MFMVLTCVNTDNNLIFLDSLPVCNTLPLNRRYILLGGMISSTRTFHKCREGKTYVDVCSLYLHDNLSLTYHTLPIIDLHVCRYPAPCTPAGTYKYGKYPVGHSNTFVLCEQCRQRGFEVEGFWNCMNNKLIFYYVESAV